MKKWSDIGFWFRMGAEKSQIVLKLVTAKLSTTTYQIKKVARIFFGLVRKLQIRKFLASFRNRDSRNRKFLRFCQSANL